MQKQNWQPETILGNKYKIIRVLPEGQMGKCYQVEHFHWNMPLRLKCFTADSFADQHGEYLKHAIDRWIAMPGAFNIVSAYCWERIEQVPCLVSEYVDGIALDRHLETVNQIVSALDIAIHISCALENAHQRLSLHGNLKPTNILITGNGIPLLEDFVGLAYLGQGDAAEREKLCQGHKDLLAIDLRQYGSLLYYIFFGGAFAPDRPAAELDFAASARGWQVPERLSQVIGQLIAGEFAGTIAKTTHSLKQCHEEITRHSL